MTDRTVLSNHDGEKSVFSPDGNDEFLALVARGVRCLKDAAENPVSVPDRSIAEIDGKIACTVRKTLSVVSDILSGRTGHSGPQKEQSGEPGL